MLVKLQFVQTSGAGRVMLAVKALMSAPPVPLMDHAPGSRKVAGRPAGTVGTPGTLPPMGRPAIVAPDCARDAEYPALALEGRSAALFDGPLSVSLVPASSGFGTGGTVLVGGLAESWVCTRQVPGAFNGGTAPGVWIRLKT